MISIARSVAFALGSLLHPRMLWLMLWPVLIAIALWGAVALVFWTQLALWLAGLINEWLTTGWLAFGASENLLQVGTRKQLSSHN